MTALSFSGPSVAQRRFWLGLASLLAALLVLIVLSLGVGSKFIPPLTVLDALVANDPRNFDHRVVTSLRLVRMEAGLLAGMALGVAGALLQPIIRNPIAEPGVLGLNAGAALMVVVASTVMGGMVFDGWARPWIAASGAIVLFGLVLGLSSAGHNGPTPLKVTLAGVAMTAFAGALTNALLILDEDTLRSLRNWFAGTLAGKSFDDLLNATPVIVVGMGLAMVIAGPLNALALGEKAAAGLGVKVQQVRLAGLVATALLAGAAVAVAGPIGFVGLVVPHIVRRFAPPDMAAIIPLCALAGACVLLAADIIARVVIAPQEVPAGIVTAGLGAPLFVYLVARYFR